MKLVYMLVMIGSLIFSGVLYSLGIGDSPSETVKKYHELAYEGKIDKALAMWTSGCNPGSKGFCSGAVLLTGEDPIIGWTKDIGKDKDPYEIKEEKIEGSKASVLVELKFENGFNYKIIYKMDKINGEWRFTSFTTPTSEEADRKAEQIRKEREAKEAKENEF